MLGTDQLTGRRAGTTLAGRVGPLVQGVAFVAVWMALGLLLRRDTELYLLVGVPLTVAFQLLVRRRPLRALWVRDAPPLRLDAKGWTLAGTLALLPAWSAGQAVAAGRWTIAAWMGQLRRGSAGTALHWLAVATATGGAVMAATLLPTVLASPQPLRPLQMLLTGAQSALLYLPVVFVLEEVSFRGALDPHLHRPGQRQGWPSALVVSALWGLWHLPLVPPGTPLALSVAQVLVVHCAIGVPLSFAWRRTGSLAVPALAHALIDGIRNGLLAPL